MQQELDSRGAGTGASELHGIACGLAATGGGAGELITMLAEQDPVGEADPGLAALAKQLLEESGQGMADDSFAFEPWLPEDEAPLGERIIALADWCGGFLLGLTMGGQTDPTTLAGDAGEAASDLVAISGASEDPGEDLAAAERQLSELTEFVRVGAMLIFEEIRGARRKPNPPAGIEPGGLQ
ncbi:MAG: UPF0149 family protein [Gammaproteobacteria bacterium]|nr:UPF0149 family protein [Gammaproteobacteria bacterium]